MGVDPVGLRDYAQGDSVREVDWKATARRSKPVTRVSESERSQTLLICVDAVTGKTLWKNRWNMFLTDVPAERVGWSSCVGDPTTGRIYAQGVGGPVPEFPYMIERHIDAYLARHAASMSTD